MISCNHLNLGGVQSVIMNVIRSLHNYYVFDVVVFEEKIGIYEDEIVGYGGKVCRIIREKNKFNSRGDIYFRSIWLFRNIFKLLKKEKYWAVHCHNSIESAICLFAAQICGIGIRICHSHTVLEKKISIQRKVLQHIYLYMIKKYSTKMVGCSEQSCESFYGNKMYNVIHNAYDEQIFKYIPYRYKGLSLIQVGAFSVNKNQSFSLDVLSIIKIQYPSVKLYLVGFELDIGYLKKIRELITIKHLENNVVVIDGQKDVYKYYDKALYMIFPSYSEGFGIALVEAQASGLRCFASNCVPKEIDCGGIIFLDLSQGPKCWAKKIMDTYEKNGIQHEKYNCSKYSSKLFANKFLNLYEC